MIRTRPQRSRCSTTAGGLALAIATAMPAAALVLGAAPAGAQPAGGIDDLTSPTVPQPVLTVSDAVAYEVDGSITFTFELDQEAEDDIEIDTSIVHGATSGPDFLPTLAVALKIAEGESTATETFDIADDDGVEPAEDFLLVTDPIPGVQIVNAHAEGRILDGDGPALHLHNDEAPEGDGGAGGTIPVTVTASYAPLHDVTFRLYSGIFGFEAEAGTDFVPLDQIVTLPAGETSVSTHVEIVGDALVEDDELLPVYAEAPSAGSFGIEGSAELRILDDDVAGGDDADSGDGADAPAAPTGGGSTFPPFTFPPDLEAQDANTNDDPAGHLSGSSDRSRSAELSAAAASTASERTRGGGVEPVRTVVGVVTVVALLCAAGLAARLRGTASPGPVGR